MSRESFEEWHELESDPGLFSLLVESLGVKNVEVMDVYDLDEIGNQNLKNVYGFIFLHKWVEDNFKKRRKADTESLYDPALYVINQDKINSIFFAKQVISNSCATLALLSVIMNCSSIEIGKQLAHLKEFTKSSTPENKGLSIANMADLASAHNKFARVKTSFKQTNKSSSEDSLANKDDVTKAITTPLPKRNKIATAPKILITNHPRDTNVDGIPKNAESNKSKHNTTSSNKSVLTNGISHASASFINNTATNYDDDRFHYVSFVPINGELYELDGLRPYPLCHGKWSEDQNWIDKFKDIITERINKTIEQNPCERYNLLAVCKDSRHVFKKKLMTAGSNLISGLNIISDVVNAESFNEPLSNQRSKEIPTFLTKLSLPSRLNRHYNQHLNSLDKTEFIDIGNDTGQTSLQLDIKNYLTYLNSQCTNMVTYREKLNKEHEKWARYQVENERRTHNYDEFFLEFFKALEEHNLLSGLLEKNSKGCISPINKKSRRLIAQKSHN